MTRENISKQIYQLLFEFGSVVVPNLGGFSTREISATIDEGRRSVSPPVKTIEFSPLLSMDDGLLVNRLAKAEGTTPGISEHWVNDYVTKLKDDLNEGKIIGLPEMGELYKTPGGIEFSPYAGINLNAETFGLAATPLPDAQSDRTPPPVSYMEKAAMLQQDPPVLEQREDKPDDGTVSAGVGGTASYGKKKSVSAVLADNAQNSGAVPPPRQRKKERNVWGWLLPLIVLALFFLLLSQLFTSDRPWYEHKPFSFFVGKNNTEQVAADGNASTAGDKTDNPNAASSPGNADAGATSGGAHTPDDESGASSASGEKGQDAAADNSSKVEEESGRPTTTPESGVEPGSNAGTSAAALPSPGDPAFSGVRVVRSNPGEYAQSGAPKGYYAIVGAFKNRSGANSVAAKHGGSVISAANGWYRAGIPLSGSATDVMRRFNEVKSEVNKDAWLLLNQ